MTRERKYNIFVSSSYEDLKEERAKVIEAIIELGQIPTVMEYHIPATPDLLRLIKARIEESDIVVVLLGHSRGSKSISKRYVEHEIHVARDSSKPILFFASAETKSRETEYRNYLARLTNISRTVPHNVEHFTTADDVRHKVYLALDEFVKWMNHEETGGWIRAAPYDNVSGPFFKRYFEFFSSLETFNSRIKREYRQKASIAEYLWEQLIDNLNEANISAIYFESGSSTAYAAFALLKYAQEYSNS